MHEQVIEIDGVRVDFVRRRYGRKTFTWLHWQDSEGWHEFGDPWPCITIPKKELAQAVAEIKIRIARLAPEGSIVA